MDRDMQANGRDNELERACAELAAHQAAIDHHALVAVVDPAGKLLRVNDLFCRVTGFGREELVGQTHRLLGSGRHPHAFWAHVWRTVSHGQVWRGEVCNRSREGQLIWLDTTIVPVRDADDHVVQYVEICTDVTERRRVEASLEASNRSTAAASRARGRLVAQAGEALRAPLASVLALVGRLARARESLPLAAARDVETLCRQAPALLGVVEDLLEIVRLDGGSLRPAIADADAAVLVAGVLAQASGLAGEVGVELRFEIASSPSNFRTDPRRLQQALACLVHHAVRRSPRGGVVTVQLRRPGGGRGAAVCVDVADEGPPLTEQQLAGMFEHPAPNERPDDPAAPRPLALCLARRLATWLGGDVAMRSEGGVGAVLTLLLPTLREQPAPRDDAANDQDARIEAGVRPARLPEEALREVPSPAFADVDRERQRVLVAAGAPALHELVVRHLRDFGLVFAHAETAEAALAQARREPPDLVLLDQRLADADGLGFMRLLHGDERLESVPVIVFGESADATLEAQAFRSGAVDFVCQPLQPAVLRARVRAALQTRTLRQLLEREALHDRLTGLPNRTLVQGRIGDAVAMKRADPARHYALLFLDFDHFKLLNDTLGHEAGDELLRQIAQRLRTIERPGDPALRGAPQALSARLGGDEFVVLLEGLAQPRDAVAVAEQLLQTFSGEFAIRGTHVASTASIGIVLGDESYGSASEVLRDADAAMYEAKAAGRARFAVFDATMRARVADRVQLERDLRQALEQGELFLEYQPIVALRTGRLEGIEALIRWTHPRRGRMAPAGFVRLAEETGLIGPIGEWALGQACRDFLSLRASMGEDAPRTVAVNVSREQLGARGFPARVRAILDATGIDPRAVQLEVTENGIMRDPEQAVRALRALKALGVGIHVDDFGTGSSSLACLHQFPVDTLKIDRSFVVNSGESAGLAALLLAIVQMARTLGLGVVAEGIETPEQLLLLQSIDCQYGQGYLLGRPMPVAAILAQRRETPPALVVPEETARRVG